MASELPALKARTEPGRLQSRTETTMNRRRFSMQVGSIILAKAVTPRAMTSDPSQLRKPIKIGQIGVGHAHASKLSVYRSSSDYEVIGIVEPDMTLRKQAENTPPFHGLRWLTRRQLLETPGLEAVLVETRVRDLLENAEACVSAGMHIQIDKPAGESLPFKALLDNAETSESSSPP